MMERSKETRHVYRSRGAGHQHRPLAALVRRSIARKRQLVCALAGQHKGKNMIGFGFDLMSVAVRQQVGFPELWTGTPVFTENPGGTITDLGGGSYRWQWTGGADLRMHVPNGTPGTRVSYAFTISARTSGQIAVGAPAFTGIGANANGDYSDELDVTNTDLTFYRSGSTGDLILSNISWRRVS